MTIGYTNDGLVFLTDTSTSPNGQPAQITLTWEPNTALQVADLIIKSAKTVKEKNKIIIPDLRL